MALLDNFAWLEQQPVKGEGSTLRDASGRDYIDLMGGIATTVLGHCHPELMAAMQEQSGKLWHISNYFKNEPAERLAQKLADLSFADRVVFQNSGTEAVEAAVKLARRYAWDKARRKTDAASDIIAFEGAFHGRTMLGISLTAKQAFREGFAPVVPGVVHLPFNDIAAVGAAVGENTAAVIVELVQGEAGVHPADKDFVRTLRRLCDEAGALLIFDEVQTGIGRTGELFAYQGYGVEPDILCLGKGLGGGLPIAATLAREEVAQALKPGTHGSTFGGNPVACAVACAVLDIVVRPETRTSAARVSQGLEAGLEALKKHQLLLDTRVHGALAGADLAPPWAGRAGELVALAAKAGVFITACGQDTIRLAPSLVISDDELEEGFARLTDSLSAD